MYWVQVGSSTGILHHMQFKKLQLKKLITLKLNFILAGCTTLMAVIIVLGYLNRYTIRADVIPSMIGQAHEQTIDSEFTKTLQPVDMYITSVGIAYQNPDYTYYSCENEAWNVDYKGVNGLAMTVNCTRALGDHSTYIDDSFKATWSAKSPDFERYLHAHGWTEHKIETSAKVTLQNIYQIPLTSNVYIEYSKQAGDITCHFEIWRNLPSTYGENRETAGYVKTCDRVIKLFGGYSAKTT